MIEVEGRGINLSQAELAAQASRLFQGVSKEYPGNSVYQSAWLARECQVRNLEPEQLRDALLDDVGALGQILKAAVANHRLSGNERAPQELPLSEVERIVKSDFSNAAQFMIVSSRKLDKFLSTYGNGEILHQSRERANRLIRNAKLRRHAVRKVKIIFETPAGSGR